MSILADLIALINGDTEKTLDVLIQEKATETNSKIDNRASQESIVSLDTKVQTGNNLIGATNNTGGTTTSGSIFAKLNKLLTDWTTTRAGYLDTINTNVGTLINGRVVKSVQYGVVTPSTTQIENLIVSHNNVNLSKSMVLTSGGLSNYSTSIVPPYVSSRTPTSITLRCDANGTNFSTQYPIFWQIIEFY